MNKIVLWYDSMLTNNCYHEDSVNTIKHILHKLTINQIDYETKITDDILDNRDNNIYVIELTNVYNEFDIFSLIPDRTKRLFRQGLSIVLYYPTEGHSFDTWLLRIYNNLRDNDLLQYRIFFINADLDLKENYKKYIEQNNLRNFLVPISIDYWKGDYFESISDFNQDLDCERTLDYLFYNGKVRPHRLLAVAELKNRDLLKYGLVSLTATMHSGRSFDFETCVKILIKHNCYHDHVKEFIDTWRPMVIDHSPDDFTIERVYSNKKNHHCQTFFSIVSETNVDVRFITEKTYRPIANYHPFIILGACGILKWLRQQGYETFPEFFDESYDNEIDHSKRIYMVLEQVEKFVRLPADEKQRKFSMIKEKLIHNKNHYFKNAETTKKKDFESIFEKIKNYEN
jgi:hypothetical protein